MSEYQTVALRNVLSAVEESIFFAEELDNSREKSLAITKLEEAKMWLERLNK